jgi:sugar/nucleoside kinase (ribokinase family)
VHVSSYQATPPAQQVVDTTGAGDCFNAGLITALLAGRGPANALALACAAGAGSTSAVGGTAGCPDLPAALALARKVSVRRHGLA